MDNGIRSMVLGLPRSAKRAIVMAVDAGLAVFSVWIAFYLRLGYFLPVFEGADGLSLLPATIVAVVVSTPIFIIFGLYRTIFRYSGRASCSGSHQGGRCLWCYFCHCIYPCRGHRCAADDWFITASRIVFICCVIPLHSAFLARRYVY